MDSPYRPYLGDAKTLPEYDHRLLRNWFFHPLSAYRSAQASNVVEINHLLPTSWLAHPVKTHFAWKLQRAINSGKGRDIIVTRLLEMGFGLNKDLSTDTRHIFTHPEHGTIIEFSEREHAR